MTNIFEYSNIYSDIHSYKFFSSLNIQILVRIVFLIRIYPDILSYQNHTLSECYEYLNIRIFKYLIQMSIWIFVRIVFVDTNIFGYSFASFY